MLGALSYIIAMTLFFGLCLYRCWQLDRELDD